MFLFMDVHLELGELRVEFDDLLRRLIGRLKHLLSDELDVFNEFLLSFGDFHLSKHWKLMKLFIAASWLMNWREIT